MYSPHLCVCFLADIPTQIASVLEEAWAPEYAYIGIIVDTEAIRKLQARPKGL